MNPKAAQSYLRTKVLTATPEQLQLMLFDGALRFCEQGRIALEKNDFEGSFNALSRVQKILMELIGALRPDVAPELCANLKSLYIYAHRHVVQANVKHDVDALKEAIKILTYQRETWVMLLEQLSKQKASIAARSLNIPSPDARMEASISMQG